VLETSTSPSPASAATRTAMWTANPPRSAPRTSTSPEFRRKVLHLLKAGRTVAQVAADLQISDRRIYNWRTQELIDTGQRPALSSSDTAELVAAHRRIAELETELAVTRAMPRLRPQRPSIPDASGMVVHAGAARRIGRWLRLTLTLSRTETASGASAGPPTRFQQSRLSCRRTDQPRAWTDRDAPSPDRDQPVAGSRLIGRLAEADRRWRCDRPGRSWW
jgi:transposase